MDLKEIQTLLREGKVQEADDLVSKQIVSEQAAAAAAAGEPPPPETPPTAEESLIALLDAAVTHLGSPPRLVYLLARVKQAHAAA